MTIRKIIAAATITGALAALPITLIVSNGLSAGSAVGVSSTVTTAGGQGNWPMLK
ncbi:MAG TPA: hypothetical protein PKD84_06760 [Propionicimonas sp.]|jgi:hypothetical protein|nr:hypothetical protein [Propionicimonas sp.]